MDADLYQEQILDRYHHPRHGGAVEHPTEKHVGANRSCGDELTITLRVENGKVKDARFESRACAICTASADLLLDKIVGQRRALADEITPDEIQKMIGLSLSPIRLKCALLPLETLRSRAIGFDSPAQKSPD